jgi:linoleoyl-CoA desaturase
MSSHTPKFQHSTTGFHQELKQRIAQYFESKHTVSTGNWKLFSKAIFLVLAYIALYVHLVFFTPESGWLALAECILFGLFTAGIGFNVMHDGGHGSFSRWKIVNNIAAMSGNIVGASTLMWKVKHNIIHHTYTNIDGIDDDIEIQPYIRMCPTQKRRALHKIQHVYVWFLYAALHLFWIFFTDYKKYFTRRIGTVALPKFTLKEHLQFWVAKVGYFIAIVVIPIYMVGVLYWMIGFLSASLVTGFVISVVFQLAHTVEHTAFPTPEVDSNKIENEWAIHQLQTTANFATKNRLISWLVGGLNFQIEHHLFPRISHVHYPAISRIIKQTCMEYGIVYHEFPRMRQAIRSHAAYLRRMGQMD